MTVLPKKGDILRFANRLNNPVLGMTACREYEVQEDCIQEAWPYTGSMEGHYFYPEVKVSVINDEGAVLRLNISRFERV
jgi:hypothetical protein